MTSKGPQSVASALILTVTAISWFVPAAGGAGNGRPTQSPTPTCVSCHQKRGDEAITLFSRSIHKRAGLSCVDCHRGSPTSERQQDAHGGDFIGQPAPGQILTMCGSCHVEQLDQFKGSRHFPERANAPRLDCARCHGAHGVGAPTRNFSFAYFCAGCHGLEYLPPLPKELASLMAEIDGLNDRVRALDESGRSISDEAARQRSEIRRMTADIVHPTDVKGLQRIQQILNRARTLEKALEQK